MYLTINFESERIKKNLLQSLLILEINSFISIICISHADQSNTLIWTSM